MITYTFSCCVAYASTEENLSFFFSGCVLKQYNMKQTATCKQSYLIALYVNTDVSCD